MSDKNIKPAVLQSIQRRVNHPYVEVLNRGNSAILIALMKLGGSGDSGPVTIFIPEEGGWMTYEKYAANLGMNVVKIKCSSAMIDIMDLRNKLSESQTGNQNGEANKEKKIFIYHALGAYCAEQPIKDLYRVCQEHGCKVIMDVCGTFGTELCDGEHADICLASFSKWKPVDYGQGGFISFKDDELYRESKPLFSAFTFQGDYSELLGKIDEVEERIQFLVERRKEIVDDLEKFEILYPHSKHALVVIIRYKNDMDKLRVISYCTKCQLEYTECPREIRVMQDSISVEVKRL
jgi:hypothetical protein